MRKLLALLLVLGAGLLLVPSVGAQAADPGLGIRGVDSTDADAVEVTFFYDGDRGDVADLVLRENGQQQDTTEPTPLEDQQAVGVVLAIDASGSMEEGALIERVKEAAHEFVAGASPNDQMAIISFNGQVVLEEGFTTDKDVLDTAIEGITLGEDTALYDAIVRSASLFEDSSLQPNIVVFSDGEDNASNADQGRAEAAVKKVGGTVFAVGVDNPGFDSLAEIASATGGSATVATDPAGVGELFAGVQTTLHRQYVVTYASSAPAGPVPIELTVGSETADAEYVMGSAQAGAA
jgi:VWFA-related protein